MEKAENKTPGSSAEAPQRSGANGGDQTISCREATKRDEMDMGKSERLRGTDEAGESSKGTQQREGGRQAKEAREGKAARRSSSSTAHTGLSRVAELARSRPKMVFTTLAHHIDLGLLRRAYEVTRKDGAVGVDGQTAKAYAQALDENLSSLLERFKSGRYRAPPVRRVYIPKVDGKMRPIGIPTFEDKILQRAVSMVLEAVYEQDFLTCSFGFRRGKGAHQALQSLWNGLMAMGGGFVLDVDVEKFFDSLDHGHLRAILDRRVRDGVIRRAIDKWLKAGVLEAGCLSYPEEGTPQGGVISPILANIFLHEVVDSWFAEVVQPRLSEPGLLVRYADDMVIVVKSGRDAERVMKALASRLGRYGLRLHPEKTRLVAFERPAERSERGARTGCHTTLQDGLRFSGSKELRWRGP